MEKNRAEVFKVSRVDVKVRSKSIKDASRAAPAFDEIRPIQVEIAYDYNKSGKCVSTQILLFGQLGDGYDNPMGVVYANFSIPSFPGRCGSVQAELLKAMIQSTTETIKFCWSKWSPPSTSEIYGVDSNFHYIEAVQIVVDGNTWKSELFEGPDWLQCID